jgi:DNA-binding MarR family transcriptional regulator
MTAMPYEERATAGLLQAAHAELSRYIGGAVVAAGFTDLRPAHGNVMEQLIHEDGLRISTLADRSGMTPQSMGELVDELERRGYVERRPDPADRRAKPVFLTARGQAAAGVSGVAVRDQESQLRDRFGEDAYQGLREVLLRLIEFGIEPSLWRESATPGQD